MNITLALKIADFNFGHEHLSNLLGLVPTAIHHQGEEFYTGPPHNRIKKVYEENYWEYRLHFKDNSTWIKTIIDQFIEEIIANKKDALREIRDNCNMEIYIGAHFDKGVRLDSYHFDLPVIKLLAELNIEIDIDQY